MKETKFIRQNHKKWAEFEEMSKNKDKDSNLYSKLYIQITDDLSYARTFYANRSVRVYLNNLAQGIFHKVFSRNRKKQAVIRNFWMEELPSIMYLHRTELLLSFIVLVIAISIGLLTYRHDSEFANKILGDGYIAMTAENIAKKDPMAVYKQSGPIEMFVRIVINNLKVDILTFFSGLVLGIGSILVLLQNGLMLSAFQFYFIQRGLFWDSFLAVWLHGTLEISAMVICGTAGLVLGKGLVFPGTYSRTQSFLSSAQRATKIFFSVLPITVAAGIIESFLTRYTQAPDILRLALIIVSLFFILGYYVYLPWMKKRNGTLRIPEAEKVLPENFTPFEFYTVKKVSEMILDTFRFFRKYSGIFLSTIFRSTLLFTLIGITINKKYLLQDIYYTEWSLINLNHYLIADYSNWFSIALPVLFTFQSVQVSYLFYGEMAVQAKTKKQSFAEWARQCRIPIILNSFIQVAFYLFLSFYKFELYTYLFILPMQFVAAFSVFFPYAQTGKARRFNSFTATFKSGLMNLFAIHTVFILLSLALFLLISSSIFWIIYQAVTMNLTSEVADSDFVFLLFFLAAVTTIITISVQFFCIYQGVFYFSQKEKHSAEGLIQELNKLSNSTRKHGL